ncbi:uncharacterized protein LOC131208650 [Anopheles bellator]|uniref:uncharacterized protein LOC131208650 n=1 Tax=Anopheles bellator TaxID=139047 RepID=UPI002649C28E|nr:uncharacterized protein LOC131208650 [Anopheles bellator]
MWTNVASTRTTMRTITFVTLFCSLLPFFIISYATVTVSRQLWLIILHRRYPWLKRTTIGGIKSFVDRSRNPEVLCVLIEMEGEIDIVQLRQEFVNHINDCGSGHMRLCFPQFILPFVSCWNKYSWLKGTRSAGEHIILAPAIQRGHSVKELMCLLNNNEATATASTSAEGPPIAKAQSHALPWQIVCFPVAPATDRNEKCGPSTCLLYTIELKLLNEAEKRNLAYIPSNGYLERAEPLFENLLEKPYYIPRLWNYIFSAIHHRWSEFVYQHDPLESPDIDRQQYSGLSQLISALFISIVYVCGDFVYAFRSIRGSPLDKIDYLKRMIEREIEKRNFTLRTIWDTFLLSIEPVNLLKELTFLWWKVVVTVTLMVPWYLWRETEALLLYVSRGTPNRDTTVGFIVECLPICYGVVMECWKMVRLLVEVSLRLNE